MQTDSFEVFPEGTLIQKSMDVYFEASVQSGQYKYRPPVAESEVLPE